MGRQERPSTAGRVLARSGLLFTEVSMEAARGREVSRGEEEKGM